jgi:hypothetical protein
MSRYQNEKSNPDFYLNKNNQLFMKENNYDANYPMPNAMMQPQPVMPPNYIYQPQPQQLSSTSQILTTKTYVQRLATMQAFSTCLIILSVGFQVVAVATNDWFVLNLNEYIPTSKGGLFNYCYITSSGNPGFYGQYIGQFNCMKYEDLPNYAIFVNSLLYDSRILMLCACGFGGLILFLELFGCFCLCCVEAKKDKFDMQLANAAALRNGSPRYPVDGPNTSNSALTDSAARFTSSIVINNNGSPDREASLLRQVKPVGYFTYLVCAAIGLVGAFMEFALKISGFGLFNTYLYRLLEMNTIFLAYRSYSYWFMVASIVIGAFYWLFKIFSLNHVKKLTRDLIAQRERKATNYFNSVNTIKTDIPYEQANRGKF